MCVPGMYLNETVNKLLYHMANLIHKHTKNLSSGSKCILFKTLTINCIWSFSHAFKISWWLFLTTEFRFSCTFVTSQCVCQCFCSIPQATNLSNMFKVVVSFHIHLQSSYLPPLPPSVQFYPPLYPFALLLQQPRDFILNSTLTIESILGTNKIL